MSNSYPITWSYVLWKSNEFFTATCPYHYNLTLCYEYNEEMFLRARKLYPRQKKAQIDFNGKIFGLDLHLEVYTRCAMHGLPWQQGLPLLRLQYT